VTAETVDLSWTVPENVYGAKVSAYIVEYKGRTDGVFSKKSFGKELQGTLAGMKPGMEYELRVVAKNSAGTSDPGNSEKVTMDEQEVVMPEDDDDGYGDDDDQAAADAAAAKASKQEAKQAKQAFNAEKAEKTAAENKAKAASDEEDARNRKGGLDAKAKRLAVAREHAYVSHRDAALAGMSDEERAAAALAGMSDEERAAAALQRLRRMVLEILMRMQGKMYLLNGTLQQKGCEALGHLAATEAGIVPEMIKLGALPVVITSMTAYPRAVTVQRAGIAVFRAMLTAPDELAQAMRPEVVHGVVSSFQKEPWGLDLNSVATQMTECFISHQANV